MNKIFLAIKWNNSVISFLIIFYILLYSNQIQFNRLMVNIIIKNKKDVFEYLHLMSSSLYINMSETRDYYMKKKLIAKI